MSDSFRTTARFFRLTRLSLVLLARQAAIGGQAVLEGVMMRGPSSWAVAIRRIDGSIEIHQRDSTPFSLKHRWARLPVIRGVIALGESLVIGFRALSVSAEYAMEWEEAEEAAKNEAKKAPVGEAPAVMDDEGPTAAAVEVPEGPAAPVMDADAHDRAEAAPESLTKWAIAGAFVLAIGFSIVLFKVTPAFAANFAVKDSKSFWFVLTESSIRISIFIVYLALVGLMPDMKRVFQYHSAEHKAINAWEHEVPLEPDAVNAQSRIHVRCGTAFLLWVFVVGILVYGCYNHFRAPELPELILSRIVGLPLLAGLSFELIRFAGRHPDNPVLRSALAPGLWMQRLTTRECDPEHCEVSIASLEAVLLREKHGATDSKPAELDQTDEAIVV